MKFMVVILSLITFSGCAVNESESKLVIDCSLVGGKIATFENATNTFLSPPSRTFYLSNGAMIYAPANCIEIMENN